MDAIQYDAYAYPDAASSYSDSSSTPRTPSPNAHDLLPPLPFAKHIEHTLPHLGYDEQYDSPMIQNDPWGQPPIPYNAGRGSLLQELYEHDAYQTADVNYIDDQAHYNEWSHQQHQMRTDHGMVRRATFPYVRHDLGQQHPQAQLHGQSHFYDQQYPTIFSDPLSADPDPLSQDPQAIKLEDPTPIVPSQLGYPVHPLHHHHHHQQVHPSFLPAPVQPGSHQIQHTDDAASKETQYLRRRCFNCHTTEPPSWRRSTLNPGKIVCNKCGLYERTHLRPRPLRFDELRAGGKGGRSKVPGAPAGEKKKPAQVKKEPREFGLSRRSSVSSNASSGNGGSSDWDDSVSIYSSQPATPGSISSTPSSGFNSPSAASFSIPRTSQSPPVAGDAQPRDGGIRLPNAPLSDIASLQSQQPRPHKAATAPAFGFDAYSQNGMYPPNPQLQGDIYRRGSLPLEKRVQFELSPEGGAMSSLSPQMHSPGLVGSPLVQGSSPQMMSSPAPAQHVISVPEAPSS
ncbi:hypothetical protein CONPUDRAFT_139653 [Coniophora puteana RWD-64-598 SS2]|uniref:GATA-type domain-containing protein n=1 Tax=Coniophora puteana (strain RWD-64-598) TaxID=741705 RepID=A0A5M3MBG0_CONPW|nr:uncharacterized protein CONPUDRAFT_139653 [Coniophora puteana RWD-64-598 SS2]EIW76224.1 hypothetical protein CONPUDRAFT_139653 [Coniophora puteana RWD-64-598 SS2]